MIDINDIKKENLINTEESKNEFLEYLKHNHPQTISDNVPNLNAIMQLLGLNTKAQGYELTFTGKALANALYNTPNTKELKFEKNQSLNYENTKNIIIKGDNLDALKLLKQSYYEKIKMIYIDPPYNTKNDDFIYKDDFRQDYKKLLLETGLLEIDEDGQEIESETLRFFNSIKSSKTHSGWLSFMLPRLKLARDLLREDGVIFISIDDNEQANLKILCDEIFGEENFVACMPRITKKAGKSTNQIANNHDYILCYSKNEIFFKQIEVNEQDYKMRDEYYADRGGYKLNQTLDYDSLQYNKKMDFEIVIDDKKYYPGGYNKFLERQSGKYSSIDWVWRWSKEKFDYGLKMNFIEVKNDRIYTKTYFKAKISDKRPYYIETIDRTRNISSIELINNQYSNDCANKGLQKIFNQKNIFDYSKSIELIKFLVSQVSIKNKTDSDIILDFFAGSGTTAQAVMELNAEDGGNRKFILVQLDEEIDEKKNKVAYDFCKNELKSKNPVISDITIERVKRASEKIMSENKNLDLGFKVFSLVEKPELISNDANALALKNHANLSPYEKALNLALQDCKTLDSNLKEILKNKIYQCEQSFYVIEFDDEVFNFLKNTQNENVYINGFDDINLEIYLNLESFLKERLKVVY
ncbi:site-specific DNA-methyltransferase [Campylobacter aviculae]|uniref:site-specific DNA-methyltransferase (adenine-specific) n=1 Tax=Campylobacter aviculae TaxID=2510190 RepID=A0A4U7BPB5_9BACT|nr:site-specific DNA-methyltransferase [Campylobacter aviculae]TKX32541.1 site-specific DNA-methyltransferase [Campylobacter aviculae]